jgi:hypothetical protein
MSILRAAGRGRTPPPGILARISCKRLPSSSPLLLPFVFGSRVAASGELRGQGVCLPKTFRSKSCLGSLLMVD